MRWLALLLLLQAPAPTPAPVPPDSADVVIGRWGGTWTTSQIGDCSMDGTSRRVEDVTLEIRRQDDGSLKAGIWPASYAGRAELPYKARVDKDKLRIEYTKMVTCGRRTRAATEPLVGPLPARAGDPLRLTGDSTTCIEGNCRFRETYVLTKAPAD